MKGLGVLVELGAVLATVAFFVALGDYLSVGFSQRAVEALAVLEEDPLPSKLEPHLGMGPWAALALKELRSRNEQYGVLRSSFAETLRTRSAFLLVQLAAWGGMVVLFVVLRLRIHRLTHAKPAL